jgi:hypothetical protein
VAPAVGLLVRGVLLAASIGVAGCGAARTSQGVAARHPALAVFRAAPTGGDSMPPFVFRYLLESVEPKMSRSDIRHARLVLGRGPGWLVPAANAKLCLVQVIHPLGPQADNQLLPPSVSRACPREAVVESGRLIETQSRSTTFSSKPRTRVVGIAPDGVGHVVVHSGGRASTRVPVIRNAYELIVADPHSVSFVASRDGRRQRYLVKTPSVTGGTHEPIGAKPS